MENNNDFEKLIANIDWSTVSETDRIQFGSAVIVREIAMINYLQNVAIYHSRLIWTTIMTILIVCCLYFNFPTRVIVFSILTLQMISLIISRVLEIRSETTKNNAHQIVKNIVATLNNNQNKE